MGFANQPEKLDEIISQTPQGTKLTKEWEYILYLFSMRLKNFEFKITINNQITTSLRRYKWHSFNY